MNSKFAFYRVVLYLLAIQWFVLSLLMVPFLKELLYTFLKNPAQFGSSVSELFYVSDHRYGGGVMFVGLVLSFITLVTLAYFNYIYAWKGLTDGGFTKVFKENWKVRIYFLLFGLTLLLANNLYIDRSPFTNPQTFWLLGEYLVQSFVLVRVLRG